jgi:hypothetical protein
MYQVIAVALGLALAFYTFTADLLLGIAPYWDNISGDNAANWIGYESFARDAWRWPIFKTVLLAPPEGVNTIFTDPIPALALLGKIIFKLTGYLPNYFGPWLFAAYALQPLAGYCLLRRMSLDNVTALVGGLLFLLFPAFIYRFGHFPLLSHWIIILSLIFYFDIIRSRGSRSILLGGLFTFSIVLINPYLLLMCLAIYFSALLDLTRARKLSVPAAGGLCAVLAICVVAAAALLGFVQVGKPIATGGFGLYSMNLLSPITPQLSAWPGNEQFILDSTGGQYEGYNYLGGGIIGIVLLAALLAWRFAGEFLKRSAVLCISVFLLAVYSLSTKIYAGNSLIASLPLEDYPFFESLSGMFRSSGRLFWPMGYLILTGAFSALYFRLGSRKFLPIALAALVIQMIDVRPLISNVTMRATEPVEVFAKDTWLAAAREHNEIILLPQFLCMKEVNRTYAYNFGLIAAHLALPINSAIINRSDVDCEAEKIAYSKNLKALATRDNPLIIAISNEIDASVLSAAAERDGLACRQTSFAYVCSSHASAIAAVGSGLSEVPTVSLEENVSVAAAGFGLKFLTDGWSIPSPWGVWGVGPESVFTIRLKKPACSALVMRAKIIPFSSGDFVVKAAHVHVNGLPAGVVTAAGTREQSVRIPLPISECTDTVRVSLGFVDLKSPQELGSGTGTWRLNWGFQSFTLQAEGSETSKP